MALLANPHEIVEKVQHLAEDMATRKIAGLLIAKTRDNLEKAKKKFFPSKYLDYDPSRLCQFYSNAVAGQIPYSEEICWQRDTLDEMNKAVEKIYVENGDAFKLQDGENDGLRGFQLEAIDAFKKCPGLNAEDSEIIRLNSVSDNSKTFDIVLKIQKALYSDQVQSNLVMDWKDSKLFTTHTSLRAYLKDKYNDGYGNAKLPPLNSKILANTIGISVILFYEDNGKYYAYLPQRAEKKLAVFEGGFHCSASSAARWHNKIGTFKDHEAFEKLFTDGMRNTIKDELGIESDNIKDLLPLALCREFLRGGKPQIFFGGVIKGLSVEDLTKLRKCAKKNAQENGRKPQTEGDGRHIEIAKSFDDVLKEGLTLEAVANLYYAIKFLKVYQKSTDA